MKKDHPDEYAYIEQIWQLRDRHLHQESLPLQYLFFLVRCFRKDCPHPVCQRGESALPCWYEGGPPISYLPLPVPDPERQWGATNCPDCKGVCTGHFLKPEIALQSPVKPMVQPPSHCIKEAFQKKVALQLSRTSKKLPKRYFCCLTRYRCGSIIYSQCLRIENGVLLKWPKPGEERRQRKKGPSGLP